jgi:hypothetical protein
MQWFAAPQGLQSNAVKDLEDIVTVGGRVSSCK